MNRTYTPPIHADTAVGLCIVNSIQRETSGGAESTPRRLAHEIVSDLKRAGFAIVEQAPPASNVVTLGRPATADVIELLEAALADARRGDLTFVAVGGNHPDGSATAAWAGDLNQVRSLAAVTNLRLRFEAAYVAEAIEGGAA